MPDINANQSADSTRVFRIPLDDATAPDLLKSTMVSTPVLTIIKGPRPAMSSSSRVPRPRWAAIPPTASS